MGRGMQAVENATNGNHDPTFLFYFYTHQRPVLHRLGAMQIPQQTDGQRTDAVVGSICETPPSVSPNE